LIFDYRNEKESIFIRLSNFKYNSLKRASLPHCIPSHDYDAKLDR